MAAAGDGANTQRSSAERAHGNSAS
jgi:hypothetical protein